MHSDTRHLCQQSMCQHVLIKQRLSTNFVNQMGARKVSIKYAGADYVKKLSDQIMSATTESIIIVSIYCVNRISVNRFLCQQILCHRSTTYVNKICRLFGFQPLMSRISVNRSVAAV